MGIIKKVVFVMVLFFAVSAFGTEVRYEASWDANSEGDLAGYKLYINNCGTDMPVIDVGNVTNYTGSVNVPDNTVAVLKFELTAYDTSSNESGRSNTVTLTEDFEPPAPPTGLIAKIIEIIVAFFKYIASLFA